MRQLAGIECCGEIIGYDDRATSEIDDLCTVLHHADAVGVNKATCIVCKRYQADKNVAFCKQAVQSGFASQRFHIGN